MMTHDSRRSDRKSKDLVLVTGGAGFIGANFILDWLRRHDGPIVNLDKLTYAGNPENLATLKDLVLAATAYRRSYTLGNHDVNVFVGLGVCVAVNVMVGVLV